MTHAELLRDRPYLPGLGWSDCPGQLVTVEGPLIDRPGEAVVQVDRCGLCYTRIAWEPQTGQIRNIYREPDPVRLDRLPDGPAFGPWPSEWRAKPSQSP